MPPGPLLGLLVADVLIIGMTVRGTEAVTKTEEGDAVFTELLPVSAPRVREEELVQTLRE